MFDKVQFVAVEVSDAIEPGFAVEVGHIDHERVALPVTAGISQPEVDVAVRVFCTVRVDGANGMAELEQAE